MADLEMKKVVIRDSSDSNDKGMEPLAPSDPNNPDLPAHFDYITENVYISPSLQTSKVRKRAKRMVCDCQFDPEQDNSEDACGENCINRLLMIECGSRCPCGEYCNNKNFQRAGYAEVAVFKTEKKGWGLKATQRILEGSFVLEYCGEVCTIADFERRKIEYSREKRRHYYFMSLRTDEILDATRKGNLSRYINHSCDPNCETQKWTVNGRLCIGFFSVRQIEVEDELTFDYQFQRFGEVAQKCYCGAVCCRGYLGQTKQALPLTRVSGIQGDNHTSPQSPSSGRRRCKQRSHNDADSMFEKDIYDIIGSSWRLKESAQVVAISRTMLQAETPSQRTMLLQVMQATEDQVCLKKFLSLQGLQLLWSWLIDSADISTSEILQFRIHVLQTLAHLPVSTKNQLNESKLLPVITRWAEPSHQSVTVPKKEPLEEQAVVSAGSLSKATTTLDKEVKAGVVKTEADSALLCEVAMETESGRVLLPCDSANATGALSPELETGDDKISLIGEEAAGKGESSVANEVGTLTKGMAPESGRLADVATVDEAAVSMVGLSEGVASEEVELTKGGTLGEVKGRSSGVCVVERGVVSNTDMIEEGRAGGDVALKKSGLDVMEEGAVKVEMSCDSSTHTSNLTPEGVVGGEWGVGADDDGQRMGGFDMLTSEAEALERLSPSRGETEEVVRAPRGRKNFLKEDSTMAKEDGGRKVEGMKVKVEDMKEKVEVMKEQVEDMKVQVEDMKEKAEGMKVQAEGMKEKAEGMKEKAEGMKEKAEGMKVKVAGLKEEKGEEKKDDEVVKEESKAALLEDRQTLQLQLEEIANELLDKWSCLKEVFRIPKRTRPSAIKSKPAGKIAFRKWEVGAAPKDRGEEGHEDGVARRHGHVMGRREGSEHFSTHHHFHHAPQNQLHQTRSSRRPAAARSHSPLPSSPHTPPYFHTHQATHPSSLYPTPPGSAGGSIQSTVIVQQPGQSICVQQQIFRNGCHQTTILPTQYIPAQVTHPPCMQLHQTSSSQVPLCPSPLELPPERSFSPGHVQPQVVPSGHSQPPGHPQQPLQPPEHIQVMVQPPGLLQTPGGHSQTPGGHSQTPGGHSQTPGRHSQTPGGHTQTPGRLSQTPGRQSETPGGHSQTPGGHSQASGLSQSPLHFRGHPNQLQQSDQIQLQPPGHLQPQVEPPGHLVPQVEPPGHLVPQVEPPGHLVPQIELPGHLLPQVQPPGHLLPQVQPPGYLQPQVEPPGHLQPQVQPPGHLQTQVQPPGHLQPHVQPPGHLQPHVEPPGHLQPQVELPGHLQPHVQPPGHLQPQVQPPGHLQPHDEPPGHLQPLLQPLLHSHLPHVQHQNPGYPHPEYQTPGHPENPGHPQQQNPGHPQPQHQTPGLPQQQNPGHPQPQHQTSGHPQHQNPGHPQQQNPGHPQPQHQTPGHPQPQHQTPGHPQHQNPGHPQPQHQTPGHPQPQQQTPGHMQLQHQNSGHPQIPGDLHPQHQTPGPRQLQNQTPGHSQPQYQTHGHPHPQHQSPGHPYQAPGLPQPQHQTPELLHQIPPTHQVEPHPSTPRLPPSRPLPLGSSAPSHQHSSTLPQPTTSLQPPADSTATTTYVPMKTPSIADPVQGLLRGTPLFGISSLPNPEATSSTLASQPTSRLPPVTPTLAPTSRNPAISDCVLPSPALGRLGVGKRMGTPGSHVADARATNVVPQDGLLPTPSLLAQGQSAAATAPPIRLPARNDVSRSLPTNWKMAKDGNGKSYYYHVITRKTQWEPPAAQDEGTITMDLGTPEHSVGEEVEEKKGPLGPHTPTETEAGMRGSSIAQALEKCTTSNSMPVQSVSLSQGHTHGPTSRTSPWKALTTMRSYCGMNTPPFESSFSPSPSPHPHTPPFSPPTEDGCYPNYGDSDSDCPTKRQRQDSWGREEHVQKEAFRHSLSRIVISCLDHHRKSDCKYGRITCAQDFKYLARKLTYGLTEKELSRKRKEKLECTDSVKARVKEYIRQYMKRFGPVYKKYGNTRNI